MISSNPEYEKFNKGMDKLLRADPAKVKAEMEADRKAREEARKAKRASSARASRAKD